MYQVRLTSIATISIANQLAANVRDSLILIDEFANKNSRK